MMASSQSSLRTIFFADLDTGVWGAALDAGAPVVALGGPDGTPAEFGPATLDGDHADQEWRLAADGLELVIEPQGDPAAVAAMGQGASGEASVGEHQLCRVRGRLTRDGAERVVDCVGTRASGGGAGALASVDSIRGVWAWFGPEAGLALLALRPRGAGGQEADRISAAIFEPGRSLRVNDPRLSTTYTTEGLPARVSLELWLNEGEDPYPRRAAGEVAGPGAAGTRDGLALAVAPFQWHSRGLEGAGLYLLARPA